MKIYVRKLIRIFKVCYIRRSGGTITTSKENIEMNPVEVKELMMELDPHKSRGLDGISPFVFKECAESLVRSSVML